MGEFSSVAPLNTVRDRFRLYEGDKIYRPNNLEDYWNIQTDEISPAKINKGPN